MFPDRDITKLLDLVARTRVAGSTLLVAIDGLGGAGKSTLAAQLGDALDGAAIVAVDDFYRPVAEPERGRLTPQDAYDRYFDWARLRDEVLAPLSAGAPSRYRRHDWVTNTLAEWHEIEPGGAVIAEGVYCTRPELRPHFDVTVFVETPREQRLARMLDRMYDDVAWVERWMAAEDWYLENVRPGDHVDLVVDGSSSD
jgi:uridine kinase